MKLTLSAAISAFAIAAISGGALAGDAPATKIPSNDKHAKYEARLDSGPSEQSVDSSTDVASDMSVYAQQQANVGYQASSTVGVPRLVPDE